MKIGELAEKTGLAASAIRYYEDSGLLPKSQRGSNGYRVYTEAEVERIRLVQLAQRLGFSLDAIRGMFKQGENFPKDEVLQQLDKRLEEIAQMMQTLLSQREELQALRATLAQAWGQGDCLKASELTRGRATQRGKQKVV